MNWKIIVVLFLLCAGIAVGYDSYGDYQAKRFCSRVPIGSDLGVLASVEREEHRQHYAVPDTGAYQYGFRGFLFSSGICEISIQNGKVSARRAYHHILR